MSKKRSRTGNFSLELDTQNTGSLPSKEEIEVIIAKATNVNLEKVEPTPEETKKIKRIPFTTALSPENRALLEASAHEGKESVADLLNLAVEYYFKEVRPLPSEELKNVFLKLFEKKLK